MMTSSGAFNSAAMSVLSSLAVPLPREKKEAALDQSEAPIQADEAPEKDSKAGNSLFDLLEDGDAVSDEEGGGLMVCPLHVLSFPVCHWLTCH